MDIEDQQCLVQATLEVVAFAGQLRDGDEFPPVRSLRPELPVAPATAHTPSAKLRDEGLLASRPGVGMVVRTNSTPDAAARLEMLAPAIAVLVREAAALHVKPKALADAVRESLTRAAGEED